MSAEPSAKRIIADLRLLSEQCGELGEIRDEIARAKSESETVSKNLAVLKQEFLNMQRQHGEMFHKFREEHKQLTQQSHDKQREIARLDAELDKRRSEHAKVTAEIAAIRQLLGVEKQ
jgi:predicted  nucleic acid-binding Zn-ribbon protein